ncbi:MAG: type II toxin-antitoxin system HicA family toxin [Phycisphaerae bacterium]|nr:type II toxin-antitoxin system HicA family toxin [Phycisphaerae bacterium]
MARRKQLKPREVVRLLKQHGFVEHHQRGSHLFLVHPESHRIAVVPMHSKDVPQGTLHSILKSAGIDI